MNKKLSTILVVIVVIMGLVGVLLLLRGQEDTWLCQNGQWVKHGNPARPQPTTPCPAFGKNYWLCQDGQWVAVGSPTTPEPITGCGQIEQPAEIIVTSPQANQIISSPLNIQGQAKGSWYFEASAPVKLLDGQGKELAVSYIQAQGDWMTENYVPFTAQLTYQAVATSSGFLVFNNDNPSGLPENSKEFKVPVIISSTETIKIKVYFNNDELDPEFFCYKVFPVEREIVKTPAVARAVLEELLKGATEQEKVQGYISNINPGVKIQKLTIEQGVAKVDFDETLERAVGGSCRVAAIRAQIAQTLEQFPTVEQVIISIDGRTEDILQP